MLAKVTPNKMPTNLPPNAPAQGTNTTSTEYLKAGWTWEPVMMRMPSVQLKVMEIGEINTVCTFNLYIYIIPLICRCTLKAEVKTR